MPKVVTFGEIMLRLSPPGFERFLQTQQFVATFGGGEANVAVCLAAFGIDSYYVTRLPKHEIGEAAVRALRAEGVRTDYIVRGGDRIGVYYAEAGASQRASTVIYDRARSAISEMEADAVDWPTVFAGAAVVPRHWNHAGAGRERHRLHRAFAEGRACRWRSRQRRPQLPQEAVDREEGARGHGPA